MISIHRKSDSFELERVHIYLRPDGSLGGKGRPDPKIIYDETDHALLMEETGHHK